MRNKNLHINEVEYYALLDDYKENILRDFKKFNYNVSQLSIEWNCNEWTMQKKLIEWGIITRGKLNNITKEDIIKIYHREKSKKRAKMILNVSYNTLHKLFKLHGIETLAFNEDKNYLEISNNESKLNDFINCYRAFGKKDTAKFFNISVYYVNRILKEKSINKEADVGSKNRKKIN